MAALILFLALGISTFASAAPLYYSPETQEATFEIQSYTFFGKSKGTPADDLIQKDVTLKMKYMLGYMRRSNPSAVMYPKYNISVVKIEDIGNQFKVTYAVSGKGVFKPNLSSYNFFIPIMSSLIYQNANGRCTSDEGDGVDPVYFWYHWSPEKSSCPLVKNQDYIKYTTKINYIKNTVRTYPEYDRLFKNGAVQMTIFYGLTDYTKTNWNPSSSNDFSADMYKRRKAALVKQGFKARMWSSSEVRQYYAMTGSGGTPTVEQFTLNTAKGLIDIKLAFLNTGYEYDSSGFHAMLKSVLLTDGVIIYNGHSGLGKNLGLADIEARRGIEFQFNDHYQIYFLGSCIPYSYYTNQFFVKKSGTKNLDILSFAGETGPENSYDGFIVDAIYKYATQSKRLSYQELIPKNATYYFGVSGDEDNPTE